MMSFQKGLSGFFTGEPGKKKKKKHYQYLFERKMCSIVKCVLNSREEVWKAVTIKALSEEERIHTSQQNTQIGCEHHGSTRGGG